MHFRCPRKDLQRSNQVENLDAGTCDEQNPTCARLERRCVVPEGAVRFQFEELDIAGLGATVFTNCSGAASKVFLSFSEQK